MTTTSGSKPKIMSCLNERSTTTLDNNVILGSTTGKNEPKTHNIHDRNMKTTM